MMTPRGSCAHSGGRTVGRAIQDVLRRLLFALVFGLLIYDAAGLDALVVAERCTSFAETVPDSSCPSTCVRCACGQPIH